MYNLYKEQISEARSYCLNLQNLFNLGTVEFRQHHSTFDFNAVRAWIRLVVPFVENAFECKRIIRPFPDKKLVGSLTGRNYTEKFTTRRKLDLFFYDVVEDADLYSVFGMAGLQKGLF